MNWIKQKWHGAEYKSKFYVFLTVGVLFLFAAVFLLANIRFYKSGANIAALTQRTGEIIHVQNGGVVTFLDACPPFRWTGDEPNVSISESELPYQDNGAYTITGSLEDACFRLIQAGFVFDTSYGGTTLALKSKICYLYLSDRTLIAQIEDLEGEEND